MFEATISTPSTLVFIHNSCVQQVRIDIRGIVVVWDLQVVDYASLLALFIHELFFRSIGKILSLSDSISVHRIIRINPFKLLKLPGRCRRFLCGEKYLQ